MPLKDPETRRFYQKGYRKRYYEKHREIEVTRQKTREKMLVKWFVEFKKTQKCSMCPESDWICLDFHHRDSKTKRYSIAKMATTGCSKSLILKEVEKCDVLCANCHRKKHKKEYEDRLMTY